MYSILLLLTSTTGLGDPEWAVRERAEYRLRALGVLAVPQLLDAAASDCPETRVRVGAILTPWRRFCADYRAARLLLDPWADIDAETWWRSPDLRRRAHRIALRHGLHSCAPRLLDSWYFTDCGGWFPTTLASLECYRALQDCRTHLGIDPGWPFRH